MVSLTLELMQWSGMTRTGGNGPGLLHYVCGLLWSHMLQGLLLHVYARAAFGNALRFYSI